jgi:hypothetical protein
MQGMIKCLWGSMYEEALAAWRESALAAQTTERCRRRISNFFDNPSFRDGLREIMEMREAWARGEPREVIEFNELQRLVAERHAKDEGCIGRTPPLLSIGLIAP